MHMKDMPCSPTIYGCVASSQIQCQLFCPAINIACALYTIIPVLKLDLVIQALLLDYIIALGKKYAYVFRASCFHIEINIFEHF